VRWLIARRFDDLRPSRVAALVLIIAGLCAPSCDQTTPPPAVPVAVPGRSDLTVTTYHTHVSHLLSDEITLQVPQGAVSLLIEVRGSTGLYYLDKLRSPGGVNLVESGAFVSLWAREVPGFVDWIYPNNPDRTLEPGEYRLVIQGETSTGAPLVNEDLEILTFTKQEETSRCGLRLDFLVDFNAVVEYEEAIDGLVERLDALYRQVGIRIIDYQIQQVTIPALDAARTDERAALVHEVLRRALSEGSARENSLHIIVVRALSDHMAGYAMGLPGPYAAERPTAAVLAAANTWVTADGFLDLDAIYTSVAHEMGHYLGLYHLSEDQGQTHDPVADTPECPPRCSDARYLGNIMTSGEGARRHLLTSGQATVMKRHPLCDPHEGPPPPLTCDLSCAAPAICAIWAGERRCLAACDPQGAACFEAQSCAPDDRGVYVCA
jgi:predicted Zn-dependent protease